MKYGYGLLIALALSMFAFTANAAPLKDYVEPHNKIFTDAYNSKNAKAVAQCYAEDAIAYPASSVAVVGRENIQKLWQGNMDAGFTDMTLTVKETSEEGKLGVETGVWAGKIKDKDGKQVDLSGDYVVVWKQSDNGEWLMHRDIWTDHPAK